MLQWTVIANYVAWYIFVFIAVTWLIVLARNWDGFYEREKRPRLKSLPKVSALIPAYNEEKTISRTLKSILNLDYPKDLLEVIVINDASTDRTEEIVKGFSGRRVKLIRNRGNRGKAYSLNKALGLASGEVIACIDADSMVDRKALKKMVTYLVNPKVAAVTPALKVWKPKNFLEKIQFAEYLLNIFLRKSLAFFDSIHVTPGVFSIYRKNVLKEIGGFDEENLTEDMEIALRIHNAGYEIENDLDAISYTICPNSLKSLFRQRVRWYRGAVQNTVKYKHMIFNSKYGNLGVFLLPMNFVSVLAVISILLLTVWDWATNIWRSLWHFYLVDWNFFIFFKNFKIDMDYFIFNTAATSLILMVLGITLGGYILYKSFNVSKEKLTFNKLGYFTYLIAYPVIMMVFWLTAMLMEIFRMKRKW